MWSWSFRVARLAGTNIRVHWSLPAYLVFYVLRCAEPGYSLETLLGWVVAPMALLFASVVCHEFGHVFVARRLGQHTGDMILTPIGGLVMVARGPTPTVEFAVAAGGPLVNAALAAIGCTLFLATGGPFSPGLVLPLVDRGFLGELWRANSLAHFLLADFVVTNVTLLLFNVLVVAYPLDGGRMLFSLLWRRHGRQRALVISCRVAQALAIAVGVAALAWGNGTLGIIAVLVFFEASNTLRRAQFIADPWAVGAPRRSQPRAPRAAGSHLADRPWPRSRPPASGHLVDRLRQREREESVRAALSELERHDDAVEPLPEDVLRQVREAMARAHHIAPPPSDTPDDDDD